MRVWICKYSKRFFRQKVFLLLLLTMPLGTFLFASMADRDDTSVRVGLVCADDFSLGGRVGRELLEHQGIVQFFRMRSDEDMIQAIGRGELECGYSFPVNMDERYRTGQYDGGIRQYFRKGSMLYAIAREVVLTDIFRQHAEDLAASYVHESGLFHTESVMAEEISAYYRKNLEDQTTFSFSFNDSTEVARQLGDYLVAPIRGCVSLLILLAGFCGLSLYQRDRYREVPAALPGAIRRRLPMLSVAIPVFWVSVAGIVSEAVCGPGFLSLKEIAYLLIYDIMVVLFCSLLSYTGIREGVLWLVALGYVCACAILTPVFINLAAFVPGVQFLACLCLPSYFLEAVFGGWSEFLQMCFLFVFLLFMNRIFIVAGKGVLSNDYKL